MFGVGLDRDDWSVMLRPWYHAPGSRGDDDNPGHQGLRWAAAT